MSSYGQGPGAKLDRIGFRVRLDTKQKWVAAAKSAERTLSDWITLACNLQARAAADGAGHGPGPLVQPRSARKRRRKKKRARAPRPVSHTVVRPPG